MEELLVITACLYQRGCSETATTWYQQRPQLQIFVEKTEANVKQVAGPIATNYLAPMALFAAGATGTLRLSGSVGLKYNKENMELIFKKEF